MTTFGARNLRKTIRTYDHDRYLATLFAPGKQRAALTALYAFNLEIAKTAEVVSDATLGQIRLQWWRAAIDDLYKGQPPQHEVLEGLALAVEAFSLSKAYFHTLIEAREADLDPAPFVSLGDFQRYAADTSSPLLYLVGEISGCADQALLKSLGLAYAVAGSIRAIPFQAQHHRVRVATDLLHQHELKKDDLLALTPSDKLDALVNELWEEAVVHLENVSKVGLPGHIKALRKLVKFYVRQIEKADFSIVHPALQKRASAIVFLF